MNMIYTYILAAVAVLLFVVAAIVALTLGAGPTKDTTPAIATVIGLAAPLLTTLVLLIRGEQTAKAVKDAKDALTDHINGDKGVGL